MNIFVLWGHEIKVIELLLTNLENRDSIQQNILDRIKNKPKD